MTLTPVVARLAALTPTLGAETPHTVVTEATALLDALPETLGEDDVDALLALLPADGDTCHGLNWTILHAIEAQDGWPRWDRLTDRGNAWIDILHKRCVNAGLRPSLRAV